MIFIKSQNYLYNYKIFLIQKIYINKANCKNKMTLCLINKKNNNALLLNNKIICFNNIIKTEKISNLNKKKF